jgi:hypothetical protein
MQMVSKMILIICSPFFVLLFLNKVVLPTIHLSGHSLIEPFTTNRYVVCQLFLTFMSITGLKPIMEYTNILLSCQHSQQSQ